MTKRKHRKNKRIVNDKEKSRSPVLPQGVWPKIFAVMLWLLALIFGLSFFGKAGPGGDYLWRGVVFLVGKTAYILPLILILTGFFIFKTRYRPYFLPSILGLLFLVFGGAGILAVQGGEERLGGIVGFLLSWPLLKFFGPLVSQIIFGAVILVGGIIFWHLFWQGAKREAGKVSTPVIQAKEEVVRTEEKVQLVKKPRKTLLPKIIKKVKEFPAKISLKPETGLKKEEKAPLREDKFLPYPLNLLEPEKGKPNSGDINKNSAIIKETLENFDILVEMAEVYIGPTVAQYTLKPAEGIKLSKITTLNNNLALALAAHPLRIEAPIPGKSLVGIEVPNKKRAEVRLRNLLERPEFQKDSFSLMIALGRDVAGLAVFADLAKMPHLLVAGSTGSGKTAAADTLMFTERGMLTFEELHPLPLNSEADFEIKVISRDGIEATKKIYNNGICQFYKLSTRRGYQVEATAEHPLWVMNEDGSQDWKPASLIKEGDYVAVSRGPALFGNKTDISDFQPSRIKGSTKKISFPQKMTPQLAQFLGFLTADGGLSIERKGIHRVTYTQANTETLSLYKKSLKELFGITQFIEKTSGSNPNNKAKEIVVNSMHLKEFLSYLGMDSVKSPQKVMPRAIREAPKEEVRAYLRALIDNDGYAGKEGIELSLSSKKLISQAQIMLLNFGIISSVKVKKIKKYAQNEYFRLSIYGEEARKFIKEIGFIRKEKYKKAKEFLKLSSNPNLDLIPNVSRLLKTLGQKYLNSFARLTNRGWKYQSGILVPKHVFSSLRTYNSGFRAPGYQSLEKILDFYQPIAQEPEYQELEKISQRNFYWDKIEKIDRTSGVGYDFFVPGSDSFVGNGFVNHNTIFLNSLILTLLQKNSPKTLRLILIDPKRVEFAVYKGIPHLLGPVIFGADRACLALRWLTSEMERRFSVLSKVGARDIAGYNRVVAKIRNSQEERSEIMPYIILIVDELADLMAAKGREIEAAIVRLAQMSRAVGIHLVIATQRPSVEVLTGLIKANITSRITFQVATQVDSRTVLDMAGAEKLLGSGDMLFLSAQTPKPKRIQAAFISEKEVKEVMNWLRSREEYLTYNSLNTSLAGALSQELPEGETGVGEFSAEGKTDDVLYEEAKKVIIEARKASASLLQRRLQIGYARAARLLDILEEKGVVGPADGAKPRQVYGEKPRQREQFDESGSSWESF